jgi:hypothetical protein
MAVHMDSRSGRFDVGIKMLEVYAVSPRTSGFMTPDGNGSRMSGQSFSDRRIFDHSPIVQLRGPSNG